MKLPALSWWYLWSFMAWFPSSYQAKKIMEHRRKYERKREEKEIKERQERIKKAREEHARAQRVSC